MNSEQGEKATADERRWTRIAGNKLIDACQGFQRLPGHDQRDLLCLILALITFVLFLPVMRFDFVDFDDSGYVYENPAVSTGLLKENVIWAFSTLNAGLSYWHPLTWLSHQLDCQLFGLMPGPHHLTNVFFHVANTVLLFLLLRRTTGKTWPSFTVAALFGWHPLHIESVAWISERKDVLSTLFWLLTILAYVRYTERLTLARYLIALFLFACGLMSKPMVVTLPCVFLLLDYWPLKRPPWDAPVSLSSIIHPLSSPLRLLTEKLPFFALSAAVSVVTWIAQNEVQTAITLDRFPMTERVSTAVMAYLGYVLKTIWPADLCVLYLQPWSWPKAPVLAAAWSLLCISLLALRFSRRFPYLLVGWLWFLGTLVPVIGLVQVGSQWMADRYTYVPLIGVFLALAWSLDELASTSQTFSALVCGTVAAALAACLMLTSGQLQLWRNTETLFQQVLHVDPENHIAHNNLGRSLAKRGLVDRAIPHFHATLRREPNAVQPNTNLGDIYALKGQTEEAIRYYKQGLKPQKDVEYGHSALARAFAKIGHYAAAIQHYSKAIEINPVFASAHANLASILATAPDSKLRDGARAVTLAERACQLTRFKQPEFLDTLAAAYAETGRYTDAIRVGEQAADLALRAGAREFAAKIESRILLYRSDKPYRAEMKTTETTETNRLTGTVTNVSSAPASKEAP